MHPLISIVIANYNYGRFLEAAIQSVVTQDGFDKCELLVVDGGSTDQSVEIIKRYSDKVTWWCSEKDRGQSDAFNKGFHQAKGKYLTWLNADDAFFPGALRAIINEMTRHPECEWFTGSCVYTDVKMVITKCFCAHRFSVLRARWGVMTVGGPSSFFTKRLYEAVGGVDESFHYVMDTDLWYKFYRHEHVKFRRVRALVVAFRQHEDAKTSGAGHATEKARQHYKRYYDESRILDKRYNLKSGVGCRCAHLFSISIVDYVIAFWRTYRLRGKCALDPVAIGIR